MKLLKYFLYVVLAIVALVLIIPVFMSSTYTVSRSVEIAANDSLVFSYVSGYADRRSWDPWVEIDPQSVSKLSGPESGVGAIYEWEGEVVGTGMMTIVEVEEPRMVKSQLVFKTPQPAEGAVTWLLEPKDGKVYLSWTIDGDLDYPMGRLMGPMMDSFLGPSLEKGLTNLKTIIEKKAAEAQM